MLLLERAGSSRSAQESHLGLRSQQTLRKKDLRGNKLEK